LGERRYADIGAVDLELGATLPAVRVAYETWGSPRHDSAGLITNAVLVLHALTGDAHVVGPTGPDQPTPGWWDDLVGPGRAIDTDRWLVVASNVLGGCRGTTGPATIAADGQLWGPRFPAVTVRDQVTVEARLADHLGIARYAAVVGGSMGGMRALEWAIMHPERVGAVVALAVGAVATADQIATQSAQIQAIKQDPAWKGGAYDGEGPVAGLGLARKIAHLTYRGELELDTRFGRNPQGARDPLVGGQFAIQSYLDHQADKLTRRFDARSYVTLSEAMNTHDVGRGRGGIAPALAAIRSPAFIGGVDSDRLYPLRLQAELAERVPTCEKLHVIHSPYGHDAFLIESGQVAALIGDALSAVAHLVSD